MYFFFSSRRRHTRLRRDWSSDVCSSDLQMIFQSFGYGDDMTDSQVYDEEIELGVLADRS